MKYHLNSWDTETLSGYAVLMATPYRYWSCNSFESAVSPLFTEGVEHGSVFYNFNLRYDVQAVLKYLPKETLVEWREEKIGGNDTPEIIYDEYRMFWIPQKLFRITKNKKTLGFYDLAQFFRPDTLDVAANKYLREGKINNPVVSNFKHKQEIWSHEEQERYFYKNIETLGQYAIKDAELTMRLAEKLNKSVYETFGFTSKRYPSTASIGEKMVNQQTNRLYPKMFGGNAYWEQFAEASYGGGMFLPRKKGVFDKVTDIDQSSAYPAAMVDLPHWANGSFIWIQDKTDLQEDDQYGWIIAELDCPYIPYKTELTEDWKMCFEDGKRVERIRAETKISRVYYPEGKRNKAITLLEYQLLKKYGYPVELLGGYVWRKHIGDRGNKYPAPFKWIADTYTKKDEYKKSEGKNSMNYLLCKIAMNGSYGKTVQRLGNPRLQNWMYGSYITATTRMAIMEYLKENNLENKVISIATDGMLIEGHPNLKLPSGLGGWEAKRWNSALFLGNGTYELEEMGEKITKLRGIAQNAEYNLKNILQKNRGKEELTRELPNRRRPLQMSEVIISKVFEIEDVNRFIHKRKTLSANSTYQYQYPKVTFGELLDNVYVGKNYHIDEIRSLEIDEYTRGIND